MCRALLLLFMMLLVGTTMSAMAQVQTYQSQNDYDESFRDSRSVSRAYNIAGEATALLNRIIERENPSRNIPDKMWLQAEAIAVFPIKQHFQPLMGKDIIGLVSFRDSESRGWSAPIFLRIDASQWEDQFKETNSNLILISTDQQVNNIFFIDKFELGKDISVLGGPFSSTESSDIDVTPGMYAYIYSEGTPSRDTHEWTGLPTQDLKIRHAFDINGAIYGTRRLRRFQPVSRQIPSLVLVYPELLNSITNAPGAF